jgi:hypothetical protein
MTIALGTIISLLLGIVVLLFQIRNLLATMAGNQQKTYAQAHSDVRTTAATLLGADSQRQTHDPASGGEVVKVTTTPPGPTP